LREHVSTLTSVVSGIPQYIKHYFYSSTIKTSKNVINDISDEPENDISDEPNNDISDEPNNDISDEPM
jgi:hypothetical protein